ncbi:hypothetical protein AALO_G00016720 [Alosa alosa]|uniref:SMB domain-containing protein n=1 Tax=Alosa alosa TaxID=278164 RepID=A0AAV6HMG9_9TELE|nr:uncharacterized protein LOC125301960 isoform X1 [Alosa alosa]KAG5286597.1 hypothetical protein AALO_G00016720 [Alosa alosa]
MKVVFLLGLLPLIGLFKEVHTQITQSSGSSAFSTNTAPQTTPVPQTAPVTEASVPQPEVKLEFKLEMTFTPELKNTSSPKFVQLASQVALALDSIYSAVFGSSFNHAEIKSFRQGSVIVDSVLIFNDVNSVPETGNVTDTLVLAASSNNSHFAHLHLNVSSIKVERSITTPAQPSKSAAVTAPPQTSPSTSHSTVFYPSASTTMRTTEASSTVLLSSTPAVTTLPGSCSSPTSLCCLGLNNTCYRNGCYCDEACVRITDCCSDYNQTCSSLHPSRVIMKVRGNLNTHRGEAAFQELDFFLVNKLKELCSNCEVLILNKTIMKVP